MIGSSQDLYNWTFHPPNAGQASTTVRSAARAPSLSAALRPLCSVSTSDTMISGVRG